MRGKEPFQHLSVPHPGITPACAGKSDKLEVLANADQDHPRVCGEKLFNLFYHTFNEGSPPRVRGHAAFMAACILRGRITPACAGKREIGLWRFCEYKDHPRVCGEKGFIELELRKLRGSPPRVRGKDRSVPLRHCYLGITPACAGKRNS